MRAEPSDLERWQEMMSEFGISVKRLHSQSIPQLWEMEVTATDPIAWTFTAHGEFVSVEILE